MKKLRKRKSKRNNRKKCSKNTQDLMSKFILKTAALLLIVSLNWTGLLAVGKTFAFFFNTEDSNANTFTAATLDLSLRSGQNNFVPSEIASNMGPGDSVARDIYIGKTSNSSPLQHKVSYKFVEGNEDFCNRLQLKIWYNHYHGPVSGGYDNRDMRLKYDDPLTSLANLTDADFIIPHPDDLFDTNSSDGIEQWFFYQITFPAGGSKIKGQECNFKFVFDGWQTNFPDSSYGFSDQEEIYSTLIDSVFIEEESVTEDEELDSEEIIENGAEEITEDNPILNEENTNEETEITEIEELETTGSNSEFDEEAIDEELIIEKEAVEETPIVEETPVIEEETPVEEVTTEGNQEQEGVIEGINEIIDEVIEEIVDEIMPDEETGDDVVLEPEVPIIEDALIIEEASADETPAVEEQPATVLDNSSSAQDGSGKSVSDGGNGEGSSDGSSETGVSSDGSSPDEDAGESSIDSGDAGDTISE